MLKNVSNQEFQKALQRNILLRKKIFAIENAILEEEEIKIQAKFDTSNDIIKRTILKSLVSKNLKMNFMIENPHLFEKTSPEEEQK